MADSVKLPVIGPVKTQWVWVGGALIVGFVGYAYWNRSRQTSLPEDTVLPEDIPQDREPPPTVVGSESFDDQNVRDIISTNPEWYTAAIDYLVSTGGFDFAFASITLGKFLARRQLTQSEANLVQAAKGAVGEPPQGGPWPIIQSTTTTPATTAGNVTTSWHGTRLTKDTTWSELAHLRAKYPQLVDSVEATRRQIMTHNPTIVARIGTAKNATVKAGWIVVLPVHHSAAA